LIAAYSASQGAVGGFARFRAKLEQLREPDSSKKARGAREKGEYWGEITPILGFPFMEDRRHASGVDESTVKTARNDH
jgi:hypothetical protein